MHIGGGNWGRKADTAGLINPLFAAVPVGIAVFDLKMRRVACNQKWIDDNDVTGAEVIGRSHCEFSPEIDERLRDVHRRALNGDPCPETRILPPEPTAASIERDGR